MPAGSDKLELAQQFDNLLIEEAASTGIGFEEFKEFVSCDSSSQPAVLTCVVVV